MEIGHYVIAAGVGKKERDRIASLESKVARGQR